MWCKISVLCVLQVNSKYIAEDLIEDFDAGLEYAEADCILDVQKKGDSLQYLMRCEISICAAVAAQRSSPVLVSGRMQIVNSDAMVHLCLQADSMCWPVIVHK